MPKMMPPNVRIDFVPAAGLTTPSNPKASEIAAGTPLSGAIETGYKLEAQASDVDSSKTIVDAGTVNTPTLGKYQALLPFYKDDLGTSGTLAPVITLGATAGTGGTFAAGPYFWKVVAISASGDSLASNEVTATLGLNGTQVINWSTVAGATGYKVYRGTVANGENVLVATLGLVLTYTDTGIAGTVGSPLYTTSIFTTAFNLFQTAKMDGWLVKRLGKLATVAPAAGDVVSVFRVVNDHLREKGADKGGPNRFEVEFFPQGSFFLNVPCQA